MGPLKTFFPPKYSSSGWFTFFCFLVDAMKLASFQCLVALDTDSSLKYSIKKKPSKPLQKRKIKTKIQLSLYRIPPTKAKYTLRKRKKMSRTIIDKQSIGYWSIIETKKINNNNNNTNILFQQMSMPVYNICIRFFAIARDHQALK